MVQVSEASDKRRHCGEQGTGSPSCLQIGLHFSVLSFCLLTPLALPDLVKLETELDSPKSTLSATQEAHTRGS